MAIFHADFDIVGRSPKYKLHNVVRAAAYRARTKLFDERTGLWTKNYSHYKGEEDLVHDEIIAPEGAPEWVYDRQRLWSSTELVNKRSDARLARTAILALPSELTLEQQIELVRNYCKETFVDHGAIVDICIHHKEGNPHAHLLITTREITPEGWGKTLRDEYWYDPKWRGKDKDEKLYYAWREAWAEHCNRALEKAGIQERVDHRSLKDRGIDRKPNPYLRASYYIAQRELKQAQEQEQEQLYERLLDRYNREDRSKQHKEQEQSKEQTINHEEQEQEQEQQFVRTPHSVVWQRYQAWLDEHKNASWKERQEALQAYEDWYRWYVAPYEEEQMKQQQRQQKQQHKEQDKRRAEQDQSTSRLQQIVEEAKRKVKQEQAKKQSVKDKQQEKDRDEDELVLELTRKK